MITLVDTSELKRPTQRKLHAAWRELQGERVLATPGVADELAPLATNVLWHEGPSEAEHTLQNRTLPDPRRRQLQQQAWWGRMWTDPTSPYRIVTLDPEQTDRAERMRTVIDPRCFPNTPPEDIPDLGDAVIVSEAMALDARLLLTSNLQSIDHIEVNRWMREHGREWGLRTGDLIQDADAAFVEWTTEPTGLERWVLAGMLACWPGDDDAPAWDVLDATMNGIRALVRGDGGKLPNAGARLLNGLQKHPDPERLVELTRRHLPSPTISTDSAHPSFPEGPSTSFRKAARAMHYGAPRR